MFSDIFKKEIEIENNFDISLLYNYRRGSFIFYRELLKYLMKNELIKVKKYFVADYEEFKKCIDLINESDDIFYKLQKYQREPKYDIENLIYIYFKFKNENFEIGKQLVSPLSIGYSKYMKASLLNRDNIITNTNENAEDFIKLSLLKSWNLYIVSKDCGRVFLYEIVRNDNFLGVTEKMITNYNFNKRQEMREAANINPYE